ncbi:TetR/AcrR family transcriptional regulator [Nocardia callitridis]|uniref:TetR/AcrR family transcriptional regulator n=1 Tax=Nocardia callitridis TaxID=648753 RepID=A0ABP9K856_9NOCA
MPRPRIHDPDAVLDAAESLAVRAGPAAVTIRAVAAATGASNGAIYHTFGSRGELLARAWLRGAHRFLAMQTELVDPLLRESDGLAAVLAAATTPADFARQFPDSARLLLALDRAELFTEVPEPVAADLAETDKTLLAVLIRLAHCLWGRRDRHAVDTITLCVVDLPTAILLRRDRLTPAADPDSLAREHLRAAVRAVVALGPTPGS